MHYFARVMMLAGLMGLTCMSWTGANEGSMRIELKKMAEELARFGNEQFPVQKPTLAVFPFQSDAKLAAGGKGVAVSQLLSHYIFSERVFTLVERNDVEKIFAEQKLSLSGAIENNTALKVGQLLGSKLLLLGTLTQVGNKYQLNARLVDSESGQILKTLFTEMDKEALDEETRTLIPLVPQQETICLSLAYLNSFFKVPALHYEAAGLNVMGNPVTIETEKASQVLMGLELKYFPLKRLSFVAGIFPGEMRTTVAATASFIIPDSGPLSNDYSYTLTCSHTYSGGINYKLLEHGHFKVIGGGGFLFSHMKYEYPNTGIGYFYTSNANNSNLFLTGQSDDNDILLSYLSIGLEYKIKQRLALGIALNSLMGNIPSFRYKYITDYTDGSVGNTEEISSPELEPTAIKGYVSLYF